MTKRRIHITESQLYGLIRRVLKEDINTGGLVYGGDAAQINSEEDLDNFLHKWTGNAYLRWKKAIAPKTKIGAWILPVKYADRGLEFYDWAVIEYFKSFFPNSIHTEKWQNGAQYGFVWGEEKFLNSEIETATDDFLAELRGTVATRGLKSIERAYGITLEGDARDQVLDFLYDAVYTNGTLHYDERDLVEILKEAGYSGGTANESIARRVNEGIDGYEDWEWLLDFIESDGELRRTIDWVIQACVKKARRGVVLDREHLANCYTLRRLCQIGVNMCAENGNRLYLSNEDKRRVREHLADNILSDVDYELAQNESLTHRVSESVMRRLRRM